MRIMKGHRVRLVVGLDGETQVAELIGATDCDFDEPLKSFLEQFDHEVDVKHADKFVEFLINRRYCVQRMPVPEDIFHIGKIVLGDAN